MLHVACYTGGFDLVKLGQTQRSDLYAIMNEPIHDVSQASERETSSSGIYMCLHFYLV